MSQERTLDVLLRQLQRQKRCDLSVNAIENVDIFWRAYQFERISRYGLFSCWTKSISSDRSDCLWSLGLFLLRTIRLTVGMCGLECLNFVQSLLDRCDRWIRGQINFPSIIEDDRRCSKKSSLIRSTVVHCKVEERDNNLRWSLDLLHSTCRMILSVLPPKLERRITMLSCDLSMFLPSSPILIKWWAHSPFFSSPTRFRTPRFWTGYRWRECSKAKVRSMLPEFPRRWFH